MALVPVILSGGAGTRLWPVSREATPKPFLPLPDGETLLAKTVNRARALDGVTEVVTLTNREYYFATRDCYAALGPGATRFTYLLEPFGRNTAAAVALAALYVVEKHGPDAVMLVLPADHLIQATEVFAETVTRACATARDGHLVTFGITPTRPETGYGYIETGTAVDAHANHVIRFVEKPSASIAEHYLRSGNFLWNSGMFCFTAGTAVAEFLGCAPDVFVAARTTWQATRARAGADASMLELDSASFAAMPDISIDYALMERSKKVAVIPSRFDWNDIGSWQSISELVEADSSGNRSNVPGPANRISIGSHNTYVHGGDRLVATVGVEDLVVVDTPDALLVAHKDHLQKVKEVVTELKARGHEAYKLHRTVARPWGTYTVLEEGPGYKMKRIEVKPGASLSLQMHHHRSEHWVVVRGTARVVNGEREFDVPQNESTFIPIRYKHRLANTTPDPLVIIEVQCGDYLGEDDIVRFEDNYGRIPAKA